MISDEPLEWIEYTYDGDTFLLDDLLFGVRPLSAGATPTGSNVQVQPNDETTGEPSPISLTFGTVTMSGTTTVTSGTMGGSGSPVSPSTAEFKLGTPPTYYDIETTAQFTGKVTICIGYEGASYPNESKLKLLHHREGAWHDITTSVNTATRTVCGETDSFSPFLVAQELYRFEGFFRPVENLPTMNRVKAGSAIPVKFSLGGYQGMHIFASGYPRPGTIACDAPTSAVVDETVGAGGSGLAYDAELEQYTYVWKTEKNWSGCRQLLLRLADGQEYRANFQFTK